MSIHILRCLSIALVCFACVATEELFRCYHNTVLQFVYINQKFDRSLSEKNDKAVQQCFDVFQQIHSLQNMLQQQTRLQQTDEYTVQLQSMLQATAPVWQQLTPSLNNIQPYHAALSTAVHHVQHHVGLNDVCIGSKGNTADLKQLEAELAVSTDTLSRIHGMLSPHVGTMTHMSQNVQALAQTVTEQLQQLGKVNRECLRSLVHTTVASIDH